MGAKRCMFDPQSELDSDQEPKSVVRIISSLACTWQRLTVAFASRQLAVLARESPRGQTLLPGFEARICGACGDVAPFRRGRSKVRVRPAETERGGRRGTADLTETRTRLRCQLCVFVCVCDICHCGVRNVTTAIGHRRGACWVRADRLNSVWPLKKTQTAGPSAAQCFLLVLVGIACLPLLFACIY